jgi:hypothetical protein
VYVRPFPDVDKGRWQISTVQGVAPVWSPKGGEIFYREVGSGRMMAAPVEISGATFRPGLPVALFRLDGGTDYDVSRDGSRFLALRAEGAGTPAATSDRIVMVENWFEVLKTRAPAPR